MLIEEAKKYVAPRSLTDEARTIIKDLIEFLNNDEDSEAPNKVKALTHLLKHDNLNDNHVAEKILIDTVNTLAENQEIVNEENKQATRELEGFNAFLKSPERSSMYINNSSNQHYSTQETIGIQNAIKALNSLLNQAPGVS